MALRTITPKCKAERINEKYQPFLGAVAAMVATRGLTVTVVTDCFSSDNILSRVFCS